MGSVRPHGGSAVPWALTCVAVAGLLVLVAELVIGGPSHGAVPFAGATLATLGCVRAACLHAARYRVAWLCLGATTLLWASGDLVRLLAYLMDGSELGFPDQPEITYLISMPFGLVGLALLARGRALSALRVLLDGWIVAAALLAVGWTVVFAPTLPVEPGLGKLSLALGYPAADLLLLSVAGLSAWQLTGRARSCHALLGGAGLALALADLGQAAHVVRGEPGTSATLDVAWTVGYGLFLAGTRHTAPSAGDDVEHRSATRGSVLLPFYGLLAGLSALGAGLLFGRRVSALELLLGLTVLCVVMVRQGLLALDNVDLTQALADREELYRSLVQGSSDVTSVIDTTGRLTYVSPAAARMFGFPLDGVRYISDLIGDVHPEDRNEAVRVFTDILGGAQTTGLLACRVRDAEGGWRTTESMITSHIDNAAVRGVVCNTRDVSDRDALRSELSHVAHHDGLTGLPNRAMFAQRVQQALSRRSPGDQPLAVVLLDLDDFKAVNDAVGHSVGDQVLVRCAERLRETVRGGDVLARLGGDEFAVLIEDDDPGPGALDVAERLVSVMCESLYVSQWPLVVGASIGVAFALPDGDADDLLRNADLAMYRAKAAGKGRVEVFMPSMHTEAVERLEVERDIRRGLSTGEFALVYQPILDLTTGQVVEVEALLRWHHPERGLVSPLDFIGIAEDCGLIVPLGRFALQEATRQLARWRRAGHQFGVAVNVSVRQLQAPGFVDMVAAALRANGLPPSALTLEITESVLLDQGERTQGKVELLREIGVRIAIDDFGTGYSSLSYLRRFPVDVLKIDRSFVDGIGRAGDLTSLSATIVRLGRELGLTLVAEGIEERAQLDALVVMGCHRGQGFLFSVPLPAAGLAELIGADYDLVAAAG